MSITPSQLAMAWLLCCACCWLSGALLCDAVHATSKTQEVGCGAALKSAAEANTRALMALQDDARDMMIAEQVCRTWRETARWYQRAYLCNAHLASCPNPKPPKRPKIKAPATAPTTATIGHP